LGVLTSSVLLYIFYTGKWLHRGLYHLLLLPVGVPHPPFVHLELHKDDLYLGKCVK
jgi:hypothetical protein